jgi:hypothetical protein
MLDVRGLLHVISIFLFILQVKHLRDFISFRFNMGMIDSLVAKCKWDGHHLFIMQSPM